MNELELKFACEDLEAARERAERIGFAFVHEKTQQDTFYINGDKGPDGVRVFLRLREQQGGASLDYHRVLSDLESEETEVGVDEPEKMKRIMAMLGMPVLVVVRKRRVTLRRGEYNLVLDRVDGLGDFAEIETFGAGSEEIEERIKAMARELGLGAQVPGAGYSELLTARAARRSPSPAAPATSRPRP